MLGKYKLTTTENRVPSDEDMARVIARGMPGTAMPAWGKMREEELRPLVYFLRNFQTEALKRELGERVTAGMITTDEVKAVAAELMKSGDFDNVDIGVAITQITDELPSPDDVERVRERLAAKGWPLDDPRDSEDAE